MASPMDPIKGPTTCCSRKNIRIFLASPTLKKWSLKSWFFKKITLLVATINLIDIGFSLDRSCCGLTLSELIILIYFFFIPLIPLFLTEAGGRGRESALNPFFSSIFFVSTKEVTHFLLHWSQPVLQMM